MKRKSKIKKAGWTKGKPRKPINKLKKMFGLYHPSYAK